jgi:hypothetical protein
MRTYFGFGDQKSADQKTSTRYTKGRGLAFFFSSFLDCGMGGNTKQSVDSHVSTISALWQKKLASGIVL